MPTYPPVCDGLDRACLKLQTITPHLLLRLLGVLALLGGSARGSEQNIWPFWVSQAAGTAEEPVESWTAAGPFFFHRQLPVPEAPNQIAGGFRPFYVQKSDAKIGKTDVYILYPIFSYHITPYGYRWSLCNLINHYTATNPAQPNATGNTSAQPQPGGFDLWPFYFSRQTGDPSTSYHAVFPLYGTMYNRLGLDRASWVIFPLYGRFEKHNVATITAPWPFIKITTGEGNHGFSFWPLFGWRAKEGSYNEQFYLWPLIYKDEHKLWQPQPEVSLGVLPFYASEKSPSATSETYLWPFFGYTDRSAPVHYHETRYFWPLFVQGRGDNIYINRWGPFYTHSVIKGIDKTWILWPLWRHQTWTESGLNQTRNQAIWFIYHSTLQQSASNPKLPPARKTHLWPLFSYWNNGAGKKQFQTLSLFASLFPYNEPIQLSYDPLFALYRYDQPSPDDRKHTLLWNFISWHRAPACREFHFGPLFSTETIANSKRIVFGCGLLGLVRESPESSWHFFIFEFTRRPAKAAPTQP